MTALVTVLTLASEGVPEDKTWWNPYLKGALVVVVAIALFVGAAYLLLYTNVGTRLGFLLTAAAFTGFITVLSLFWITGQFPNGPLGPEQGWPVQEVVSDLSESSIPEVRNIRTAGGPAPEGDAGQIVAELEAELTDDDGEFDLFGNPSEFLAVDSFTRGGGRKWPMWWSEHTTYGAVEICPVRDVETLPLEAPPTPECDPQEPTQWAVTIKDLGARRLPAWFFFFGSGALFALSLFSLHRYELDQQRAAAGPADGGDAGGGGEPPPSGDGRGSSGGSQPATSEPSSSERSTR